jgi:predicted nucleic acid-binding protein
VKLIVDAGPIFAYLSADDPDHARSVVLLESFNVSIQKVVIEFAV